MNPSMGVVMRVFRSGIVLAGAAGLVGLSACGTAKVPPQQAEPPIQVLPVISTATMHLPLDKYRPDPEQALILRRADTLLFQHCMTDLGFRMDLTLPKDVYQKPYRERYMLTDETAARTRGYHPAQPAVVPAADKGITDSFKQAATGTGPPRVNGHAVPAGGCRQQAQARLSGAGSPPDAALLTRIQNWAWQQSQRDSRVTRVFTAWSQCMHRAGFSYPTPLAANDDPAFRTTKVSDHEKSTAVADVACKRDAQVTQVWAAVEAAYEQVAITQESARLENIHAAYEVQLRAAVKALKAAGLNPERDRPSAH
jgi:hypothetical protein